MASSSTAPRPEYQHFVPQFLLRNFAHPYKHPKNGTKRQRKPKEKGARIYAGDLVVNNVNLLADPLAIEETLVKRIFGINDMYQDMSQPTTKQQRHIESLFSKLESEVSHTFRKIVRSFEKGDPSVWLTRVERDRVRKFLFLLKYRGSQFHQRFYHVNAAEYEFDDQHDFREYMREKGFERPVDVWFNNIKVMAELDMDVGNEWMRHLLEHVYPNDAMWFISHVQKMYMAICTPSDSSEEFVLTDRSYNIYEGVNSIITDPSTGESKSGLWLNFHEFAPVSPRLTIVLRNFVMPVPEEDSCEAIKEEREFWRYTAVDSAFGADIKSALADLPIQKARNNYTEIVNGQARLIKEDWSKSKDDKFCFSFFRIGAGHVNKINGFMLDNAYACTSVIFGSRDSFVKTLEWYMTEPCLNGKLVVGENADKRLNLLRNLAALMKSLGSNAEPVWDESPKPQLVLSEFDRMKLMNEELQVLCEEMTEKLKHMKSTGRMPQSKHMDIYTALGGSTDTFFYDMEQSRRMLKLRIKLDSWSHGVPEDIRSRNRELLIDTYMRLPAGRVWFYLQRVKMMILTDGKEIDMKELETGALSLGAPENILAEAYHLAKREKLNRMIYNTTMNSAEREKHPAFEPWLNVASTTPGALFLIRQTQKFIYRPGKLKECGITDIERLAIEEERLVVEKQLYRAPSFDNPFYDEEDKIELLTRVNVRPKFRRALCQKVKAPLLKKMEAAFFNFTYPTPPVQ